MLRRYSDDEILNKLKARDERVTKVYFYDILRVTYHICDRRYFLRQKPGLDFYSLAHEYYLALDLHDWKPLENRKHDTSLQTWMSNGFRFHILDKLKQANKEVATNDLEERAANMDLIFDLQTDDYKHEVHQMVEEICSYLGHGNKKSVLLRMMLIEGYKGKEVALRFGLTPSAITQQYHKLMKEVVIPYFKEYYESKSVLQSISGHYRRSLGESSSVPGESRVLFRMERMPNPLKNMIPTKEQLRKRTTPNRVKKLADNEIFVFGSNLAGMHGGGAALTAYRLFGAKMGQGVGLQGRSYGIPTMQGGPDTIAPYVNDFITFAREHPQQQFLVTRIGCGIAGFDTEDIAPLFQNAIPVSNISLPCDFWEWLQEHL